MLSLWYWLNHSYQAIDICESCFHCWQGERWGIKYCQMWYTSLPEHKSWKVNMGMSRKQKQNQLAVSHSVHEWCRSSMSNNGHFTCMCRQSDMQTQHHSTGWRQMMSCQISKQVWWIQLPMDKVPQASYPCHPEIQREVFQSRKRYKVISQTEASSSLVLKCPQWVVLSQLQKPLVSRISLDSPLNALSWLLAIEPQILTDTNTDAVTCCVNGLIASNKVPASTNLKP